MEQLRHDQPLLEVPFARVPLTVLWDPEIDNGTKLLYSVLYGHMRSGKPCAWPSQARLAQLCNGVSKETIRRWTRDLETRGLLTLERRPNNTIIYWIHTPLTVHTGVDTLSTEVWTPYPHGCGPEVEVVKQIKGKRLSVPSKLGTEGLADELLELRKTASREDLSLIDEYLELAANENKSGTITMGRRLNETRWLLELRETLGADAWRHGMRVALKAEAPNANYVKKVGQKYDPEKERKRERNSDPDKISDAEWQRIQLHRQSLIAQGLDPDGEEEY